MPYLQGEVYRFLPTDNLGTDRESENRHRVLQSHAAQTRSRRRFVMRARLQSPQTPRMTKLWPSN